MFYKNKCRVTPTENINKEQPQEPLSLASYFFFAAPLFISSEDVNLH